MDNGKLSVENWKALAEIFLKNDTRALIKDIDNNFYFCDILFVGEDSIRIQCFDPPSRKGLKFNLYWPLIIRVEEYIEGGGK